MYDTTKPYTKQILELIKQTWETPYVSVKKEIIEKKFSHPETSSSDGIGTKGVYHWQQRSFRNAVLDGLGMNLNDLLLLRARPYKLQNHIFVPKEDGGAILEIIKSLSKECKEREINLGLDLKGGMNVVLEVSVGDIVNALAGNSQDPVFREAMKLAYQKQKNSGRSEEHTSELQSH